MKKKILYFSTFVFIFFILPAMLTNTKKSKQVQSHEIETKETTEENKESKNYEYKNYGTINLFHSKTGEVEEVKLDEYLVHVVSAEMPADYEIEALKAQAIVARTYTIYKIKNKKHENADICDNFNCCQAWISKEDRLARWEER